MMLLLWLIVAWTLLSTVGADDKSALEALYTATNGANWADNTGWTTQNDIASWFGVVTKAVILVERVASVDLGANCLAGKR
jgi:hypothetical protein